MARSRPRYPRSKRRYQRKRTARHGMLFYDNCRLDHALKYTFKKIGVPEPAPFQPDTFQLEALDKIRDYDVLVSAPTGSGKTWIATRAIEQNLSNGLRTWYASPLKALSNSLYQEFIGEFGANVCGILTGERKENPGAPVIVGTTEILRNQLYDAMHEGTSLEADLIILDEAHYLSDPDRGVVWEEVLIYLPPRVRLLLLSATISNAEELCDWLMENRKTKAHVVRAHERPVPLEALFLFPDGLISPLAGKKGLSSRIKKFISANLAGGKIRGASRPRYNEILSCLRKFDLLPAIFFLKSRTDCDQALELCDYIHNKEYIKTRLKNEVNDFLRNYPHLKKHRHLRPLTESLVASHHAGQLPYWKILIEKLMNRGYLEAIFSTSTVAAGVNFPARTVVLVQSDRFNGYTFTDLTSTDLHQMTGRAGRRGMDNIGFAMVIPGRHQDPRLINKLMGSTPESLVSRLHINFSMTLNLLLSHSPSEIKILLDLSFANFQQKRKAQSIDNKRNIKRNKNLRNIPKDLRSLKNDSEGISQVLWLSFKRHLRFLKVTGFVNESNRLSPDGIWASKLRLDQPLLIAEAIRREGFKDSTPEAMAGCIALFVWDRDQEVALKTRKNLDITIMEDAFNRLIDSIEDIIKLKEKKGFKNTPIMFWPGAAVYLWAEGISWDELMDLAPIGEGDMASLIIRTADHLRQVENLRETHPQLAIIAKQSKELILREPVLIT